MAGPEAAAAGWSEVAKIYGISGRPTASLQSRNFLWRFPMPQLLLSRYYDENKHAHLCMAINF